MQFLTLPDFTTQFGRTLGDGEQLQADRLLTIVSEDIAARKPDVKPAAATQVVFEVVRDALNLGAYEKFASFTNTTSRRTESGTFDPDAKTLDDYLTGRQKRLLGLATAATAAPRGRFTRGDY